MKNKKNQYELVTIDKELRKLKKKNEVLEERKAELLNLQQDSHFFNMGRVIKIQIRMGL